MVLPLQQCLFLSSPYFIPSRRQSAFCMPPKEWCVELRKSIFFFFHPRASLCLRVATNALPLSNMVKDREASGSETKRVTQQRHNSQNLFSHARGAELYPLINIRFQTNILSESSGAPPASSCRPPRVPSACSGKPPLFGGRRSSPPGWGELWVAGWGWFVFPVLLLSSLLPLKDTHPHPQLRTFFHDNVNQECSGDEIKCLTADYLGKPELTRMLVCWKSFVCPTFNHVFELLEKNLLGHFSPWRARRSLRARWTWRTRWTRLMEEAHTQNVAIHYTSTCVFNYRPSGFLIPKWQNITHIYVVQTIWTLRKAPFLGVKTARHTASTAFTRGRLRLRHFPGKLSTGLLTKSIHEPSGSTLWLSETCSTNRARK